MKKVFVILIALIGFGISVNAQQYRDFYSDGNITAQIRERYSGVVCGKALEPKSLLIKNKTNRAIKVTGIVKIEFCECRDPNKRWIAEKSFETTISAGSEDKVGVYYKPSPQEGYTQILGFWIDEIDGQSAISSSNYGTQQSSTVPEWLIGTWYNDNLGNLFTVTGNQMRWYSGEVADYVTIDGATAFFEWRPNTFQGTAKVILLAPNRALYDNSSTGNSYVVKRR